MNSIEVVGLGALNIDHLHRVEHIVDDGESVVKDTASFPGGSAANTVYGLAKLGVNSGFIGVVGDDADGEMLVADFQKVGVDISQIKTKQGAKTGSAIALSDESGKRSLYVLPGANNLLTVNDLDIEYINQTRILHISSFADDRQFNLLPDLINGVNSSVKVSFSPGALFATRKIKTLKPVLSRTLTLFVNVNEIWELTGEDIIIGTKKCLEQGCQIVVVTLGKGIELKVDNGTVRRSITAYVRDSKDEYFIEPASKDKAPEVDTTGAGDAFAAGFLFGLLNGKGLVECGHLGDCVARLSITKRGAREGLPTRTELAKRYLDIYEEPL